MRVGMPRLRFSGCPGRSRFSTVLSLLLVFRFHLFPSIWPVLRLFHRKRFNEMPYSSG